MNHQTRSGICLQIQGAWESLKAHQGWLAGRTWRAPLSQMEPEKNVADQQAYDMGMTSSAHTAAPSADKNLLLFPVVQESQTMV